MVFFALNIAVPIFLGLPAALLGGILVMEVWDQIRWNEVISVWRSSSIDFFLWATTFTLTVAGGVEFGVGMSIGLSFAVALWRLSTPSHTALMQSLDAPSPGIIVFKFQGPLVFSNTALFRERFHEELSVHTPVNVLIDMGPVAFASYETSLSN